MLHRKKWIAIILCFLALLITFSILSPKSVHAASRISYTHLNHFTHLMPDSEGPPGCVAIQLGDYVTNVNYAGSGISVENQLLGWYALAGDERYHFCDQILCVADVGYNGGKPVPAGIIGVYCGYHRLVSKRSNPTTGGDGITDEATVTPGYNTSCAQYWIGGSTGPSFNTGGGCKGGQELRDVPGTL
jgi:hypothetical protein